MQNIAVMKFHGSIDSLCFYLPVLFRPGISSHYSVLVHKSNHHHYTFHAMISNFMQRFLVLISSWLRVTTIWQMNQLNPHWFCGNKEPFILFSNGSALELMLTYFLIFLWSKGDSINDLSDNWTANVYRKKSIWKSKCSQRKCWLHIPTESHRLFLKIHLHS